MPSDEKETPSSSEGVVKGKKENDVRNDGLFTSHVDAARFIGQYSNLKHLKTIEGNGIDRQQRDRLVRNCKAVFQALDRIADVDERLEWVNGVGQLLWRIDPDSRKETEAKCRELGRGAIVELKRAWENPNQDQLDVLDYQMRDLSRVYGSLTFPGIAEIVREELGSLEKEVERNAGSFDKYLETKVANLSRHRDRRLSDDDQKALESLTIHADRGIVTIGGRVFLVTGGKRWRVEVFSWGETHERGDEELLVSLVDDKCPARLITVPFKKLAQHLEDNKISDIIKLAEENYQSEKKTAEKLRTYDLPKEDKIVYFRVFPKSELDSVERANVQPSAILCSALRQRYRRMETPPILYSDRPAADLENNIRMAYERGCRCFCLDLYSHGSPARLMFRDEAVNAEQLSRLFKQFPKATFQLSTIGCYGGGLRGGFLQAFVKDSNLAKRVTVFLQSKPDTPNFVGRLRNAPTGDARIRPSYYSTRYYVFLTQALLSGKTYGEAVHAADLKAKDFMYTDAEAIIDGQLYSRAERRDDGTVRSS